jgi:outer membrane protein assembly factor BamE (lipoprotein component of BamABCDE complex)
MRIVSLLVILAFLFSAGCLSAPIVKGKPFDAAKRGELVKGKTTMNDMTKILGQPSFVEPVSPGVQKFVYEYYKEVNNHWYAPPSYDKQTLEVFVKKGVVEKYDFTHEYRGKMD